MTPAPASRASHPTAIVDLTSTAPTVESDSVYDRRWWTLGVLCMSLILVVIGNSSLNVALPELATEFNATNAQLQWVVAGYSLVFAGLLFTTGALGDRFGRKGALQAGLVIFLVGTTAAAFAGSMTVLIICRLVMGAGAALVMPSTLSILVNVFPAEERTRAIAIWAGITGGAAAFGPVASGWLLNHSTVGSVFLINVPVILVALVAGHFLVPTSKDPFHEKLDLAGAVLSSVGIGLLVYGLIEAPEIGWSDPKTTIAFVGAAIFLAAFVAWEMRSPHPMLDMKLFKNPAFSTAAGGMLLVFLAMYGVMFLITMYFQFVLGYSPLETAIRMLPITPLMIYIAPQTPKISARFGTNRTVAFGLGLVTLGLIGFRGLGLETPYWYTLAALAILVIGISLASTPMTSSMMSAVPPNRAGQGSSMNDATRELGAALGVAVLGSIATSHYATAIADSARSLPGPAREAATNSLAEALGVASKLPGEAGAALSRSADLAYVGGVHLAVTIGAVLTAIASILVYRYLPSVTEHGATEPAFETSAESHANSGNPLVYAD